MSLGQFKVSTKILSIIGLLGLVCAGITAIAVDSLSALSDASERIDVAAHEIRLSGDLNRLAVVLSRDEYRLAADPTTFETVTAAIGATRAEVLDTLGHAKETADPEQARLLAAVEHEIEVYGTEIDRTLDAAGRGRDAMVLDERQKAIVALLDESRLEADRMVAAVQAYIAYTDDKGIRLAANAAREAEERTVLLVALAAGGTATALGLGWLVSTFGIVRPIKAVVACLRGLADGRLDTAIYGVGRRDEVGAIADTADVFKRNLLRTREMEREAREAEERATAEKREAMLDLAGRFEARVGTIVGGVGGAATELQATAAQLAAAVDEAGAQSTAVAAAAEQASANVQTVATASEEMAASINDLSARIGNAAGQSRAAADGAAAAQRELDALATAMEQVDQVVAAINAVAVQTNLLALNATIEAARAGEAGRGFAIVAQEVKSLASQTHDMTGQIGGQIAAVKEAAANTLGAMQAIMAQVADIDRTTGAMAASVEQQSAATTEISRNAQEAATGTAEVTRNVVGIQQAAGDTGSAAATVKVASDALAEQSAGLKLAVDTFLAEVRAA